MSSLPYYVPTYVFPGESRALRVSSLKVSKDDKDGVWPVEFYDKGGVWTVEFYEKPTPDPRIIRGGAPTKGCNIAENCRGDYLVVEESKAYMVPRATFEACLVKKDPHPFGSRPYLEAKLKSVNNQLAVIQANWSRPANLADWTAQDHYLVQIHKDLANVATLTECLIAMAEGEAATASASSTLSDFIHSNEALAVGKNAGT